MERQGDSVNYKFSAVTGSRITENEFKSQIINGIKADNWEDFKPLISILSHSSPKPLAEVIRMFTTEQTNLSLQRKRHGSRKASKTTSHRRQSAHLASDSKTPPKGVCWNWKKHGSCFKAWQYLCPQYQLQSKSKSEETLWFLFLNTWQVLLS